MNYSDCPEPLPSIEVFHYDMSAAEVNTCSADASSGIVIRD
jgi:hypothetical protein